MDISDIINELNIETDDFVNYDNHLVEKIYKGVFITFWVLFSQLF